MRQETLAVHAGRDIDPATGAVVSPIHLSTTFLRGPDGDFPGGHVYSRSSNPNREALESALAALEGGVAAAAFSSGMAAVTAVMQSLAPGDHILVASDTYHGTSRLIRETFVPWGLDVTFVDMTSLPAVQTALQKRTRLLWVETPSNPLLKITDLAAVAALAHEAGALCVCDNTWATPILQLPLQLGVDLVMHSTSKYLGGHSDLLGGAIIAREEGGLFAEIRRLQTSGGGTVAFRLLACASRPPDAANSFASAVGECPEGGGVSQPAPGYRESPFSRSVWTSGPRDRAAADGTSGWDDGSSGVRRSGGSDTGGGAGPHLYQSDQSRRPGKPDRAPGLDRGARIVDSPESAAAFDWIRAPGRPDRRSGAGALAKWLATRLEALRQDPCLLGLQELVRSRAEEEYWSI